MLCDFKKSMRVNSPPWPMPLWRYSEQQNEKRKSATLLPPALGESRVYALPCAKRRLPDVVSQSSGKDLTTKSFLLE